MHLTITNCLFSKLAGVSDRQGNLHHQAPAGDEAGQSDLRAHISSYRFLFLSHPCWPLAVTHATRDVYEGQWDDGKRHGQGKYTYADGDAYEGQWEDNMYHGRGKFMYASGSAYEGQYKDGKRHGQGTRTYSDGTVYEGQWEDGRRL